MARRPLSRASRRTCGSSACRNGRVRCRVSRAASGEHWRARARAHAKVAVVRSLNTRRVWCSVVIGRARTKGLPKRAVVFCDPKAVIVANTCAHARE